MEGHSSAVIMIVNVIQQVGPIRDMPDSSVRVAVVKPRSDQTSALWHRNDRQGEQKRSRSLALMVLIMKPTPSSTSLDSLQCKYVYVTKNKTHTLSFEKIFGIIARFDGNLARDFEQFFDNWTLGHL